MREAVAHSTDWWRWPGGTWACSLAVVVLVITGAVTPVRADAIRLGNLWIDDVEVRSIEQGRLVYVTPTGRETRRPLRKIEQIRIDGVPALDEAGAAYREGRFRDAIQHYRKASKQAETGSVKNYIRARLIRALLKAGEHEAALKLYVEVAGDGVDRSLLPAPPVRWLREADEGTKQQLAEPIERALNRADESLKQPLARLQAIVAGQQRVASPAAGDASPTQVMLEELGIVLPKDVTTGPIVNHLRAKRFERAIEAASAALSESGESPRALYLRGVAQLALAQRSDNRKRLKDAGLSFMSVVIYYDHVGGPYLAPSRVEAATVQARLGHRKKAKTLKQQALRRLDAEADPVYLNYVKSRSF